MQIPKYSDQWKPNKHEINKQNRFIVLCKMQSVNMLFAICFQWGIDHEADIKEFESRTNISSI